MTVSLYIASGNCAESPLSDYINQTGNVQRVCVLPIRSLQATIILLAALIGSEIVRAQQPQPEESGTSQSPLPTIEFVRDVRPIFEKHCYRCHGADKIEGGLRLDLRAEALRGGDAGLAIQSGNGSESLLLARISTGDADVRMPLRGIPLTAVEIDILKRWIDEGAIWPASGADTPGVQHWAFEAPVPPDVPPAGDAAWPRNAIDRFVLARLASAGLQPSAEADRYTLIRRVYFDLVGLPPSAAAADEFVSDQSADAYERLVDRLLASPHYGERWAREWLDLAHYADTNGYEKDRPRSVWPYRDWVIAAFNADMPFDQFTIEQIAGDMLPGASISQRTATGFFRNTMVNEEGGIDPQEDRFKRIVDRINTTGTTWLGLTISCAQCHSHKYDPISQREYYQFFGLLNNADEISATVPDDSIAARRVDIEKQIAAIEAEMEGNFPIPVDFDWTGGRLVKLESTGGATMTPQRDGSVLVSGANPATDTYTIVMETDAEQIAALRLEALTNPLLTQNGPGRAENGNFVLSELDVTVAPADASSPAVPLHLSHAVADFSQDGFSVGSAIDGIANDTIGWAIYSPSGQWNMGRTATFETTSQTSDSGTKTVTVTIQQKHGGSHCLGCFRLSIGNRLDNTISREERHRQQCETQFTRWKEEATAGARAWTVLQPKTYSANAASLTLLEDNSVLAGGDVTKRDVFEIEYDTSLTNITALRLEALPHPTLPGGGPGREDIDNAGDFFLSELIVTPGHGDSNAPRSDRIPIAGSAHSFAGAGSSSALAFDGNEETSWTISGGHGQAQSAVFSFEQPVSGGPGTSLKVALIHFSYYPVSLGRFRISVTDAPNSERLSTLPAEIESLLVLPDAQRTSEQQQTLRKYFLSIAPELAAERKRIAEIRKSMPSLPTTLVVQERLREHARITHIRERGEYLKPTEAVAKLDVPAVLHPLPDQKATDRLALAQWLVDRRNPLTARVVMNRHWAKFFGQGLVRTTEDFGTRGEPPTHPELLDWLATEFMDCGWSQKTMHRLIVTSSTYRQSSQTTAEAMERDPQNLWLARSLRLRVEAEAVRDIALSAAGLLDTTVGGPSVFPPQPAAVTGSAFGGLQWKTETNANRYRRGLYTYAKRTAPYAAFVTFDAPSHEACTVRRERSNTPLQALTMLNDTVFVESSQALARRVMTDTTSSTKDRLIALFRNVLTRPPTSSEMELMQRFLDEQLVRFRGGEVNAVVVAGGTHQRWDFAVDTEGWISQQQSNLAVDSGVMRITSSGNDPRIIADIRSPAGLAVLRFRARCQDRHSGRVYWLTVDAPEAKEANSTVFESVGSEWHEYALDLNAASEIVGLRFDPGQGSGDVEVDWMELSYSRLPEIKADTSELAAWTTLSRAILNLDSAITRE